MVRLLRPNRLDAGSSSVQDYLVSRAVLVGARAPNFRVTIDPNAGNGLRVRSQVMVDKPTTIGRERIGQVIGRLGADDFGRLNIALVFVMGLAD